MSDQNNYIILFYKKESLIVIHIMDIFMIKYFIKIIVSKVNFIVQIISYLII